ncbi:MAG: SDR family NAD(P)-dependent oxidoreductase [Alphaproteobacteria bacterium]|nr:SDR family NAD(P)-dependent oxidoreductase [Alphaproteobacteria bacterium]
MTGASSGIGEAVVRRLVADGAVVAGLARRGERLAALRAELGERFLPVRVDLSVPTRARVAMDAVRSGLGQPSVLVYAAGFGDGASLLEGEPTQWQEQCAVNVVSAAACVRALLPDFRDVGGHVVLVSSMSAHRVPCGAGMYAATKHAVRALAEGLRLELRAAGSDVRVSQVSPGNVDTRFALAPEEPSRRDFLPYAPLAAEDVAELVAYVLAAPPHVEITDVLVRPTGQPS